MALQGGEAPVQEGHEYVVFVPGTRVGDEVRVRVTRVMSSVAFAEVVRGG